jgi:hypothetical protein
MPFVFWAIVTVAVFALLNHSWLRLYLRVQTKRTTDMAPWFLLPPGNPSLERRRQTPARRQPSRAPCKVIPIDAPRLPRRRPAEPAIRPAIR